ncbi:MAG: hypothetical protein ABJM55_20770, partial [Rhodopirellula bahusiensis]
DGPIRGEIQTPATIYFSNVPRSNPQLPSDIPTGMEKDRSRKKNCIRDQNANSKHFTAQSKAQTAHRIELKHSCVLAEKRIRNLRTRYGLLQQTGRRHVSSTFSEPSRTNNANPSQSGHFSEQLMVEQHPKARSVAESTTDS